MDNGHFSRLVSELSLDERAKLLERLKSQSKEQPGPLYEDAPDEPAEKIEINFATLPWYLRIWYAILSFFKARAPAKLYEDSVMGRLARSIEDKAPGFYNFQKDLFLPRFQEILIFLRDASRFFYSALDASLNRDRGGLIAFLGSLEMPDIHRRLTADADPEPLVQKFPETPEPELRQKALRALDTDLSLVSEDQRMAMYKNARSLHCLKELSSFLYDRMINTFIPDAAYQGGVCPSASIRDQLAALNNILNSLRSPPPMPLLSSLFVFVLSDRGDEAGFDLQIETKRLLAQSEAAIDAIRDFNKQVPLTEILRCVTRDTTLCPTDIGGGEDWFAVYKDYWKQTVDGNFSRFVKNRRNRDLQTSFRYFFKGAGVKTLDNVGSESNPVGVPVKGALSLAFLQTFYGVVFIPDINKSLRPILIDADFVNKENRAEFAECYNNIIKSDDLIRKFDHELSTEGDFGQRYYQAKNEISSLPVKRRKTQLIQSEASQAAEEIIGQTRTAMEGMVKLLGGIVSKKDNGKYGPLSNLQVLGRPQVVLEELGNCIEQFKKALKLMDDIEGLENSR